MPGIELTITPKPLIKGGMNTVASAEINIMLEVQVHAIKGL